MKQNHFQNPGIRWGIAALMLTFAACTTPTITSLDPPNGSEGMVVEIAGTSQLFASIEWDGATVPGPWYGGTVFTVPYGATAGSHDVTLSNSAGTSAASPFTVDAPVTIPAPEIKGVQLGYITWTGAGAFDAGGIMVYGSNIDVGAEISIGGTAVTTFTHQVMVNDFCGGVDPTTFGNPAYHYTSLITPITGQTPGTTISIVVTNLDGEASAAYSYTLPTSDADIDSDGDGLLDDWEDNGYDADGDGTIDVDLPAMGCDKHRQDLLVEVDIMAGLTYTPSAAMWTSVEQTFANAPILNYNGEQGIQILIDRGQGGAFTDGGVTLTYTEYIDHVQPTAVDTVNLYDIKTANFDANRLNIFRYCVWGYRRYGTTATGRAEGIFSNDFYMGIDWYTAAWNTDQGHAELFVHELGHTLGFGHGGPGTDGNTDEPNHLSVMSYVWQFVFVQADWTSCTPCLTANSFNYSEGMAADLVESNLNENLGVCDNAAIDWNGNTIIESGISFNINPDDGATIGTLDDYDEWHNIKFDFTAAGSNWGSN